MSEVVNDPTLKSDGIYHYKDEPLLYVELLIRLHILPFLWRNRYACRIVESGEDTGIFLVFHGQQDDMATDRICINPVHVLVDPV